MKTMVIILHLIFGKLFPHFVIEKTASEMLINLLEVTQLLSHRPSILAQLGMQATGLTYPIHHSKPLREADSFEATELAFNLPKEA